MLKNALVVGENQSDSKNATASDSFALVGCRAAAFHAKQNSGT